MKKILTIILTSILMISCNSQIDLETLKYDEDVSKIIKNLKNIEEDQDPIYGLLGYRTDHLQQYRFGEVSFSKYEVPDGNAADYSSSYIHVNNFKDNKFLGITLSIANEEEGNNLILFLTKKYGEPKRYLAGDGIGDNGKAYFWSINTLNQWIFLDQYKSGKSRYTKTRCIIVKQGIRIENSTDQDVINILESFKMHHTLKNE